MTPSQPPSVRVPLGAGLTAALVLSAVVLPACKEDGAPQTVELAATDIGDPTAGKALFEAKNCNECHSYEGQGGTDAPPLDFMKGRTTAREVADMMGTLWNHIPHMIPALEAEQIPYPTFSDGEMADLLAYLHGGSEAAGGGPGGAPAGHQGGMDLPPTAIGDASVGAELFEGKKCSECHSFEGVGGNDAPPFDYMKGHMSATELGMMSGKVWNSFPYMYQHFMEEGIEVPKFEPGEAADLVAFLHGGGK